MINWVMIFGTMNLAGAAANAAVFAAKDEPLSLGAAVFCAGAALYLFMVASR